MRRWIGEGGVIPWGWAIAYRDFDKDAKAAYPIPLHFLVRWARDFRHWLMSVGRPGWVERRDHGIYMRGRADGERLGARIANAGRQSAEQDAHKQGMEDAMRIIEQRFLRE